MNTNALTSLLLITAVAVSAAAPATSGLRRLLPTVSGNLAITKERAERGEVRPELELANELFGNHLVAQAVEWYLRAAEKGNVEAKFRLGDILLKGAMSEPDPEERVPPKPADGVRWTYEAATNFHSGACRNMSYVLVHGIGVDKDMVEAYAWLEVCARTNSVVVREDMDSLALRMALKDIREAHTLAQQFLKRQWPHHVPLRTFTQVDLVLKLNGITVGPVPLAIINGRTLEAGGSVLMSTKGGPARVNCVKITRDSVLVEVEGEEEPRVLRPR